jgi:hypothetical protein
MTTIADQIAANLKRQFNPEPPPRSFAQPIQRNDTDFGTGQINVTTNPVQVVGPRSLRGAIKITNLTSTEIFLGNSSSVSTITGDLLPAGRGQWVKYDTASAIWAVATVAASVSWSEVYE